MREIDKGHEERRRSVRETGPCAAGVKLYNGRLLPCAVINVSEGGAKLALAKGRSAEGVRTLHSRQERFLAGPGGLAPGQGAWRLPHLGHPPLGECLPTSQEGRFKHDCLTVIDSVPLWLTRLPRF